MTLELQALGLGELEQLRQCCGLQSLGSADLKQLRECSGKEVKLPPHHGLPGRSLFIDQRFSKRTVTEDLDHFEAIIVTDKHALAAHEHWHRKTKMFWARPKQGFSGALLDICQQEPSPEVLDESSACEGVPVSGDKLLTIAFSHKFMTLIVDFIVKEVYPMEFDVCVLKEERRHVGKMRQPGDTGFEAWWEEYYPLHRKLHKQIAGTAKARGTVRMSDILDGATGTATQHAMNKTFPKTGRA
mmetsp:Transcript_102141/g.255980  ORF Transcript_102141/g.255980 Transcript_102141/m.255980 type:complete len:243 (+) Transcript_102141:71-799(+)